MVRRLLLLTAIWVVCAALAWSFFALTDANTAGRVAAGPVPDEFKVAVVLCVPTVLGVIALPVLWFVALVRWAAPRRVIKG